MMSGHNWKRMDWLSEHAGEADCRVEMTTNLAYDQDTLMRFLDACSRVSVPIWLFTSGECTEKKIEDVRDGLDWELWNNNIDHVLNSGVIAMTGICGTLSAASADGFTDFLYWLADRKRNAPHNPNNSKSLMLSVNPVRFPTFQNVVILPPALRLEYSQEIDKFLEQRDIVSLFATIELDHIKRYSTYLREVKVPHEETQITHTQTEYAGTLQNIDVTALGRDFKSFFSQYDQRRNQNFVKTFPRLSEWYAGL